MNMMDIIDIKGPFLIIIANGNVLYIILFIIFFIETMIYHDNMQKFAYWATTWIGREFDIKI